jgi:hypothetical protein
MSISPAALGGFGGGLGAPSSISITENFANPQALGQSQGSGGTQSEAAHLEKKIARLMQKLMGLLGGAGGSGSQGCGCGSGDGDGDGSGGGISPLGSSGLGSGFPSPLGLGGGISPFGLSGLGSSGASGGLGFSAADQAFSSQLNIGGIMG